MAISSRFKTISSSLKIRVTIIMIALVYLGTDLVYQHWTKQDPVERGVIHWDIISYYAYLPATFIYGDVTLGFLDHPPEGFTNDNKFWSYDLENGQRLIVTSMGMSMLYAPGFFMAHALAPVFGQARDGFSNIYQLFLVLICQVYVFLGLIILKNLLLRYFTLRTTIWTLVATALGTNLFFYATHEAPMAHAPGFFLFLLFLWLVDRWYSRPNLLNTLFTGTVLGLISLIRPTSILVVFVLLLYKVTSFHELGARILYFLKKFHLVVIMLAGFLLVWIPQFLYWHAVTGQYIFYSYGPHGGEFFFGHPHIAETLFSYKKGWFVYSPIMFFAVAGIPLIRKRISSLFWPVIVLLVTMIYVQSSWWCWWFGGSFGMRAYVEIVGILALPMAASLEALFETRRKWLGRGLLALFAFMLFFQQFQTYQYKEGFIHYNGMNRFTYWRSFMRLGWHPEYWSSLTLPDYDLARKGIYVTYISGEKHEDLKEMGKEKGLVQLTQKVKGDRQLYREVERYAKRSGMQLDKAVAEVAEQMYDSMTNM
jgi:hypothetical protein